MLWICRSIVWAYQWCHTYQPTLSVSCFLLQHCTGTAAFKGADECLWAFAGREYRLQPAALSHAAGEHSGMSWSSPGGCLWSLQRWLYEIQEGEGAVLEAVDGDLNVGCDNTKKNRIILWMVAWHASVTRRRAPCSCPQQLICLWHCAAQSSHHQFGEWNGGATSHWGTSWVKTYWGMTSAPLCSKKNSSRVWQHA